MALTGQMINYKKYTEQLKKMPAPILPSQLPKASVDLQGMIAYARSKGISTGELSDQEMDQFISGSTVESLRQEFKSSSQYKSLAEWNALYGNDD